MTKININKPTKKIEGNQNYSIQKKAEKKKGGEGKQRTDGTSRRQIPR